MSEAKKEEEDGIVDEPFDFDGKNVTMESTLKRVLDKFENLVDEDSLEREDIISEAIENVNAISGSSEDSIDLGVEPKKTRKRKK